MPDTAISALPAVSTPLATDVVPIVSGGVTSKVTLHDLVAASGVSTGGGGGGGSASPSTVPFTPRAIPGLVNWYDPSDASTITVGAGGAVSALKDKSNNGFTLTQATAAKQPSLVANAFGTQPGLQFTKANSTQLTSPASIGVGSAVSMFAVVKISALPSNCIWFKHSDTNGIGFGYGANTADNPGGQLLAIDDGVAWVTSGFNLSPGPGIFGYQQEGSTAEFNVNGTGVATAYPAQAAPPSGNIYLGGYGNTRFSNDIIGEIICYDHLLTTAERQQVEGYLANKWGTAALLPVDHPYHSSMPTITSTGGSQVPFLPIQESFVFSLTELTSIAVSLEKPPQAGNTLLVALSVSTPTITPAPGWTQDFLNQSSAFGGLAVYTKISDGTETAFTATYATADNFAAYIMELPGNRSFDVAAFAVQTGDAAYISATPSIAPSDGAMVFGAMHLANPGGAAQLTSSGIRYRPLHVNGFPSKRSLGLCVLEQPFTAPFTPPVIGAQGFFQGNTSAMRLSFSIK